MHLTCRIHYQQKLLMQGLFSCVLLLCGCQYDGSFMHMHSDAPFPFFGLQLSVENDARNRPMQALPDISERVPAFARSHAVDPSIQESGESAIASHVVSDSEPYSHALFDSRDDSLMRRSPDLVPTSAKSEQRSRVRCTIQSSETSPAISTNEVNVRINDF